MPWVTSTIQNIFNVVLRGQTASPAFPGPGTGNVFLGLFTTAPNINGTGFVEVNSTQLSTYIRRAITFGPPATDVRTVANTNVLTFSASAAGSGPFPINITHGGVFSASTGGVLMAYGILATPLPVNLGSLVEIPIGLLTITDNVTT